MISKILSWCRRRWWLGLPLLVAVPLWLLRGMGRAILPSWVSRPHAPVIDPGATKRERERIQAHAEAERDRVNKKANDLIGRIKGMGK